MALHRNHELRQNRLQALPTNAIRSLPCNNERFFNRFIVYTPFTWTSDWEPLFPGVVLLATEKPDGMLAVVLIPVPIVRLQYWMKPSVTFL
jgi:hypothetical protein